MMRLYTVCLSILFLLNIGCTGGQSVSFVLLCQPSDCIDLVVIVCVFVLFSENKYHDDVVRLPQCIVYVLFVDSLKLA